jgi:hypothetical protein
MTSRHSGEEHDDQLCEHTGRGRGAVVRGGPARRARRGWRAVRAGGVAGDRPRRTRRTGLSGDGGEALGTVYGRLLRPDRAPGDGAGGLWRVPSRGHRTPGAARPRRVAARALSRADPGLQGLRHAAPGPHVRGGPHPARPGHHHRRRHLGGHRGRGGSGLCRARADQGRDPLSRGPDLGRPAAADDDCIRGQCQGDRSSGHVRRLPEPAEGDVRG